MSIAAFELNHAVVRAGAGAGKTTSLIDKVTEVYLGLSAQGRMPRLVVTTFTRKATQELKERLVAKACDRRDSQFLQFVSDPGHLQVSTIDGLLNMFLRRVGHLAGLDSGFQIVSEGQGRRLARLALRQTLVAHPGGMRWLEDFGFQRVLEMCRRYANALGEFPDLKPASQKQMEALLGERVLYWRQRVETLVEEIDKHANKDSWRKYGEGLENVLEGWDGSKDTLTDFPRKPPVRKPSELEGISDLADETIKEFKKEMQHDCWQINLWPKMESEWQEWDSFGREFASQLGLLKETQGQFEMSDLQYKTLAILREHPYLGATFSDSWDFWMIDEYQDTSPLQVELLRLLIGDKPRYYVGDPQQSIYLFRGAQVEVFNQAEKEVEKNGGELRLLLKNYRSRPELLLWINDFVTSMSSQFKAMEPKNPASTHEDAQVMMIRASDPKSELQSLAWRVQELVRSGARYDQICILGRTHRNLMDVSRVLKDLGLPTHVHSAMGFSKRREVVDARALWKFLLNPHDNHNLLVLLRSPWFLVPDGQLVEWMESRPQSLWVKLNQLQNAPDAVTRLKKGLAKVNSEGVVRTFERLLIDSAYLDLSLVNDPAGRKESNLWKLIHKARSVETQGESLLSFLTQEVDPLEAMEGDATSAQEPNCINLMTVHSAKGLGFDHVLIPCMGEEPRTSNTASFAAENGLFSFPIWQEGSASFIASPLDIQVVRKRRQRELEEHDRLLYVALTRAKQTLTLSWSQIERESWAKRSPWFEKPAGLIRTQDFTVEIVDGTPAPTPPKAASEQHAKVRIPWNEYTKEELTKRQSVTDIVESIVPEPTHKTAMIKRWEAQNLGSRLHKHLESIRYVGFERLEAWLSSPEADPTTAAALDYVLSIQMPPMRELIAHGKVEWGFQVQTRKGVTEGQVDLWAKHNGRIYVVDYKSGTMDFKESAFSQLSLYAWALRRFGHKEAIELVAIYPLDEKMEGRPFTLDLFDHWESKLGDS